MSDSDPRKSVGRLWADDRKQQILRVAARLLSERGVDGLRIPDVAAAAGVTRPVVYRHFPNRQAILMDLLESAGDSFVARLEAAAAIGLDDLPNLMRALLESLCNEIEDQGPGMWLLLNSTGPDPDVEAVAQAVRERMVAPWYARVAAVTRTNDKEAIAITAMLYGMIPSAVTLWQSGALTKQEAVEHLMKGVGGLIDAYTREQDLH